MGRPNPDQSKPNQQSRAWPCVGFYKFPCDSATHGVETPRANPSVPGQTKKEAKEHQAGTPTLSAKSSKAKIRKHCSEPSARSLPPTLFPQDGGSDCALS